MTFQPKKLSLVGIALLVASFALIFLSKLAVNQVAFNLFLLSSFTDVAALNMYTLLFAVAGYVLMAAGAALFVYVAWRSRFVVDAPTVKRQLRVLIVAVAVLLVTLSLFCTQAASANSLATTGYYLATPYSPYDWLIGNFSSGSYYAINGSNWANMMTWPSPAPWSDYAGNSTQVIEAALAATTAGTVYLKEVPMDYGLTIPANVQVIENVNGLTRVFVASSESVGSPYTISVDTVNPTYYTVQDCADRFIISWTSTVQATVISSVATNSAVGSHVILSKGIGGFSTSAYCLVASASENVAAGAAVIFSGVNQVANADASTEAECAYGLVYLAVSTATTGNNALVLQNVEPTFYTLGTYSFSGTGQLWLGTTDGVITETYPTGSGDQLVKVGRAINATTLMFAAPNGFYMEHS